MHGWPDDCVADIVALVIWPSSLSLALVCRPLTFPNITYTKRLVFLSPREASVSDAGVFLSRNHGCCSGAEPGQRRCLVVVDAVAAIAAIVSSGRLALTGNSFTNLVSLPLHAAGKLSPDDQMTHQLCRSDGVQSTALRPHSNQGDYTCTLALLVEHCAGLMSQFDVDDASFQKKFGRRLLHSA